MSKPVLFLVHGIGRHKKDWSSAPDGPVAALEAAMRNYDCFGSGDKLSKYFEVVEIRYDDVFDNVLTQWSSLAQSLPAVPGFNWGESVKKLLTECGDDSNTFARLGGDILLYEGFELIARAVRLRVNSVVTATLHRALADAVKAQSIAPPFAVLAHSMGTAVAQDALFQLATNIWREDHTRLSEVKSNSKLQPIARLATNPNLNAEQASAFKAVLDDSGRKLPVGLDSLYLVADTSPLLHRAAGLYSHHQPTPGNFDCGAVCTIAHDLDPVCKIGASGSPVLARPNTLTIAVKHLHEKNIHGFGHYLSHPLVHARIFRRLIPTKFLSQHMDRAQQIAQASEWTGFGGKLAQQLTATAQLALQSKLTGISTGGLNVLELRGAVETLFKIVESA
jgi:hypothetical protein